MYALEANNDKGKTVLWLLVWQSTTLASITTEPPQPMLAMRTSPTLSHITRCMPSPTMKPTIPMDSIQAVALPV
jgi:hypothetical protein